MRLKSSDSARVILRPVRYQFPDAPPSRGDEWDWDANWLVIRGDVSLSDGRSWWFEDACLTTREARELGEWVSRVARADPEPETFLEFTEPNLAFTREKVEASIAHVRVHFSLESLPPWVDRDSTRLHAVHVPMSIPLPELSFAAQEWDDEVAAFPER